MYLSTQASLRKVNETRVAEQESERRSYQLYAADGAACTAEPKAGARAVLSHVVPHFGTVNVWRGIETEDPPASEAQIATDIWRMAKGRL